MIDLHCHVLRDVDDGVRTLDQAVELARAAEAEGVTAIAATPHVRDDYPTDAATMEVRVAELNAALEREGVGVEILRGGELSLEHIARLPDDGLRRFGLGGNPKLLLVEFPYYGWPVELAETVLELLSRGIVPLLAHPERSGASRDEPERLRPLVDAGAYVQLTAASVDGRLGPTAQSGAERLLELELAHVIASDAHHPDIRAVGMSAAREAVGDEALGAWLTEAVPRALVAGEPPPPRPRSSGA
ncbi:MAG: tyrosine-protein phosphatase [Gaiellaceae bacterium]